MLPGAEIVLIFPSGKYEDKAEDSINDNDL